MKEAYKGTLQQTNKGINKYFFKVKNFRPPPHFIVTPFPSYTRGFTFSENWKLTKCSLGPKLNKKYITMTACNSKVSPV